MLFLRTAAALCAAAAVVIATSALASSPSSSSSSSGNATYAERCPVGRAGTCVDCVNTELAPGSGNCVWCSAGSNYGCLPISAVPGLCNGITSYGTASGCAADPGPPAETSNECPPNFKMNSRGCYTVPACNGNLVIGGSCSCNGVPCPSCDCPTPAPTPPPALKAPWASGSYNKGDISSPVCEASETGCCCFSGDVTTSLGGDNNRVATISGATFGGAGCGGATTMSVSCNVTASIFGEKCTATTLDGHETTFELDELSFGGGDKRYSLRITHKADAAKECDALLRGGAPRSAVALLAVTLLATVFSVLFA